MYNVKMNDTSPAENGVQRLMYSKDYFKEQDLQDGRTNEQQFLCRILQANVAKTGWSL